MNKSLTFTLFIVGSVAAMGQPTPSAQPPAQPKFSCRGLNDVHKARAKSAAELSKAIMTSLRIDQTPECFAKVLATDSDVAKLSFGDFAKALEAKRSDKQAGSSAGTGGSSSLVSKGVVAETLSLAAEYGALTESTNQQVVTVQGSLGGLVSPLVGANLLRYCPTDSPDKGCVTANGLRLLRRISYGVSFDTSANSTGTTATAPSSSSSSTTGSSTTPVTFSANGHNITAFTGKVILWSTRDASSDKFQTKWKNTVSSAGLSAAGSDLMTSLIAFLGTITVTPEDVAWFPTARDEIAREASKSEAELTNADLDELWRTHATEYVNRLKKAQPDIVAKAADFLRKTDAYRAAQQEFIEDIANQPVLTFEYDDNRPAGKTPTSTFRLIFDKTLDKAGKTSLTVNAGATIYNTAQMGVPAGGSRFRDAQVAAQLQHDLGNLPTIGAASIAAAYYYQDQTTADALSATPGNPVAGVTFVGLPSTATTVFGQKGNINVFQARLVLGAGTSSMRFPIAVSWSNRTELIAKPTWKAQLGVSYDLDSLFAK